MNALRVLIPWNLYVLVLVVYVIIRCVPRLCLSLIYRIYNLSAAKYVSHSSSSSLTYSSIHLYFVAVLHLYELNNNTILSTDDILFARANELTSRKLYFI